MQRTYIRFYMWFSPMLAKDVGIYWSVSSESKLCFELSYSFTMLSICVAQFMLNINVATRDKINEHRSNSRRIGEVGEMNLKAADA